MPSTKRHVRLSQVARAIVVLSAGSLAGCATASPAAERETLPSEPGAADDATSDAPRGADVGHAEAERVGHAEAPRQAPSLRTWLSAETEGLEPTKLMILGTTHLAQDFDEQTFDPALLDAVVAAVSDFEPSVVGVEARPPAQIWALRERDDRESWSTILELFDPATVELADRAEEVVGLDWGEARLRQRELLGRAEADDLSPEKRRRLVLLSLRAYDLPTATLQWRYLEEGERVAGDITESLAADMDSRLTSPNEIVQIGVRVAYEHGLQRVHALDDQMSLALQTEEEHAQIEAILEESSIREEITERYEALQAPKDERASEEQDLLPVYRLFNSDRFMRADAGLQWAAFFDERMDETLGRTRIARREVRDLTIASNVRAMTARHPGERALVVYGASHKSFLESYLRDMIDLEIVQFEDYAPAPE